MATTRSYIFLLLTCYSITSLVCSQSSETTSKSANSSLPADSRMNYPKLLEQILSKNKTVLTRPNKRLELKQEAVLTSPLPDDLSSTSEPSTVESSSTTPASIQPTGSNNKTDGGEEESKNKIYEFIMSLVNRVDRYTLIMICAFLSFFLLIIITIWIIYCVCRGCSKLNRPKRQQELINPAYEFRMLNRDPPNPNIDFLDSPLTIVTDGNNNDKKKSPIYKGDTPKSWSGDEEKALLDHKKSEEKDDSHLAKQEETSSTSSSDSSLDSIIARTSGKKSLIGTPKNNKDVNKSSVMITPPPSATTSTPTTASSSNAGGAHKFTPSLRDKTKQQISKEVQSSRRSLVAHQEKSTNNSRTKSESSSNFELPPHYPSKRRSIVSSTSSINGGGVGGSSSGKAGSVIDFSVVKNEVDDLFEDMAHNKNHDSHSSMSSINQSHHSINVSVSNIYMDAIREKREQMENEKRARLNQNKSITAPPIVPSVGINMNPTGGSTNNTTNLTKTYSTVTLESEKSCY